MHSPIEGRQGAVAVLVKNSVSVDTHNPSNPPRTQREGLNRLGNYRQLHVLERR